MLYRLFFYFFILFFYLYELLISHMTMPDWLFISLFQKLTEGVLQIKSWIKEFFGIFWHLINTHTRAQGNNFIHLYSLGHSYIDLFYHLTSPLYIF
jgi:hypothetical protein